MRTFTIDFDRDSYRIENYSVGFDVYFTCPEVEIKDDMLTAGFFDLKTEEDARKFVTKFHDILVKYDYNFKLEIPHSNLIAWMGPGETFAQDPEDLLSLHLELMTDSVWSVITEDAKLLYPKLREMEYTDEELDVEINLYMNEEGTKFIVDSDSEIASPDDRKEFDTLPEALEYAETLFVRLVEDLDE